MLYKKYNLLIEITGSTPDTRQEGAVPENYFMGDLEVIPGPWLVFTSQRLARRLLYSLLLALFLPLPTLTSSVFNQDDLRKIAEFEGFGYKTANLMLLQKLAVHINQMGDPTFVTVPNFIGITDAIVKKFLAQHGLNIQEAWEKVLASAAGPLQQKKMLKTKQLGHRFQQELLKLRNSITTICSNGYLPSLQSVDSFLKNAQANNWHLMVRSTGKEDTDTLANAGGNESVANVPPTLSHLAQAMGVVLCSYLSNKSLQQRLSGGDTSIFEIPFMPVLIQRMIGEPLHGAKDPKFIPTGCVLYTTEAEGFTPGVAFAQASFGHNEGVVQSSVPIDSFFLDKDFFYKSIRKKTKRLVPSLENLHYGLKEQENPKEILSKASLNTKTLRALSKAAREIELFYKKPMDVELVVTPHDQTIYLVQARPIVVPQTRAIARYFTNTDLLSSYPKLLCTVINSNRGVLLESVSQENIIISQTLEKALAEFNSLQEDKNLIKLIAVEEEAEATSHAAAVFRGEGIVVIRLGEKIQKFREIFTTPKAQIAVSTQQGLIIETTKHQKNPDNFITEGLASHPTNLPLSISSIPSGWQFPHLFKQKVPKEKIAFLLKTLKSNPSNKEILEKIHTVIKYRNIIPRALASKELGQTLRQKQKNIQNFTSAIINKISKAQTHREKIFHIRMLELALTQLPNHFYEDIYSRTSIQIEAKDIFYFINTVITNAIQAGIISETFIHDPQLLALAKQGYDRCLNEEERKHWFEFLNMYKQNQGSPSEKKITVLLEKLIQDNLLGGWLNTSLPQAMQQFEQKDSKTFQAIATILYKEFESSLAKLKNSHAMLEILMGIQISEWENPQKFDALYLKFKKLVVDIYSSGEFEKLLEFCSTTDNNILKLAVVTTLKKITDRIDLFIKAIKGSTLYPSKNLKIKHFHAMVSDYTNLLAQLCENEDLVKALDDRLNDYDEDDENELVISTHFNVNVVVQQNMREGGFSRQKFVDYIETLEDVFTSTHQVLLDEISKKIAAWDVVKAVTKPKLIVDLEDTLDLEDLLVGVSFENSTVTFSYNRKLRAHSIQIELAYNCITQSVNLSYHFYGFNEFLRWNLIRDYISLASPKHGLKIDKILLRDYGLSLHWYVDSSEKAHILDELLDDAIDTTFELSVENRKTIFNNLDVTFENLFEKCVALYKSEESFISSLTAAAAKGKELNLLSLPVLDDIAELQPQVAKIIFKQSLALAKTSIESESHDNLVSAQYILGELALALEEFPSHPKPINQPKRIRVNNYKSYRKIVSNFLSRVTTAFRTL